MIREILTSRQECIKLGIIDSQVDNIRSQVEEEKVVRLYQDGHIAISSAVGAVDVDELTQRAEKMLPFEISYPVQPTSELEAAHHHVGDWRSLDELIAFVEGILMVLREEYPEFVFSHIVKQNRNHFSIKNDLSLSLQYDVTHTEIVLFVKKKGSGNVLDTFVGAEGGNLDSTVILKYFRKLLDAERHHLEELPVGRQRILFPHLEGSGLCKLFQSDLVASKYATGSSVFSGKIESKEVLFNPKVRLVDSRDAQKYRVCPFDMEGVIREQANLPLIADGYLQNPFSNKRDALRYGLKATGCAIGGTAQVPISGAHHLALEPTLSTLVELLDGEAALMPYIIAGQDVTQVGDLGVPVMVLLRVEADGRISGRYPGCMLSGNLYQVLGDDFVGVSREYSNPFSREPFVLTHMNVHPG